jgi:acetoin utilization deacetylase AcuC-like enzyme
MIWLDLTTHALSQNAPLCRLLEEAEQFDSVYLNEETVTCARKAAGGLMRLVREVVEGRQANGLAVIRPPGHHAESHHAKVGDQGWSVLGGACMVGEKEHALMAQLPCCSEDAGHIGGVC